MCLNPGLTPEEARNLGKTATALLEGALLLAHSQREPLRVRHAGDCLKVLHTAP